MSKRWSAILAGVPVLGVALVALPGGWGKRPAAMGSAVLDLCDVPSPTAPVVVSAVEPLVVSGVEPQGRVSSRCEKIDRLTAELGQKQEALAEKLAEIAWQQASLLKEKFEAQRASLRARLESAKAEVLARQAELEARAHELAARLGSERAQKKAEEAARAVEDEVAVIFDDGGAGWLGVSISEVTAEKAGELKLPAERGVVINEVEADSPAAKAGLKANDVITEFNGQRVEGTAQFRRMVRETPAGRAAQLTVWRDGRAQNLSAQLGSRRGQIEKGIRVFGPRDFDFDIEIPDITGHMLGSRAPVLGIQADDISGQLGAYFGAPEGEGVLIREVHSASPAEKAGLKAGDVITKLDGERTKTTRELRAKLREKHEQKTISVSVIRKGAELSVNVEIEPTKSGRAVERRRISRRLLL